MARATILIVDDDEAVRTALGRSLRRCEYELRFASSAQEGLNVLQKEPVDIVISDQRMPQMSGLSFLEIVRDRHPEAIRIILTGCADTSTAIDAINEGEIYRFLTKPWDDVELQVTLHLACDRLELERQNRLLLAALRCHGSYEAPEPERPAAGIGTTVSRRE